MSRLLQAGYRLLNRHSAGCELPSDTRTFSLGGRPVIRWIKRDGLDDVITRSAIAQATRLFGETVDYCLCTIDISASRVRSILAWAKQPVEWWPLHPSDNLQLLSALTEAGCNADHFGYWWKWFPERVRPAAPEWILEGSVVLSGRPDWFAAWYKGQDRLRVTQDDRRNIDGMKLVDRTPHLYSGLISLPPHLRYTSDFLGILGRQTLLHNHERRMSGSIQGVVTAAFEKLGALPILLSEFPLCRASEENLHYGLSGPQGNIWGYNFDDAFGCKNPHFARLTKEGGIFWQDTDPPPEERFIWMRNRGQWGRPGWSMEPTCVQRISGRAKRLAGRPVLELGTSRGHLTAVMAAYGCRVTTVDHTNRSAKANLDGLEIQIVTEDAAEFLRRDATRYALITADLHGNSVNVWCKLWPLLLSHLQENGEIVLYNSHLHKMRGFRRETGISWVMQNIPKYLSTEVYPEPLPGMVICRYE
jgi:protein-L-isoaspartate O-methyltransferase